MTNATKIKNFDNGDLASLLMCPYDTFGLDLPCSCDGVTPVSTPMDCHKCILKWLEREAE